MHSIWDRLRFWDSSTWKRVACTGNDCNWCAEGWKKVI